jgi:hypothetical protein
MKLRDHDLPCEHEGTDDCYEFGSVWFCSWQEGDDGSCPGGAVVPVVEVQWCDTHKANAPSVGGMCWIATVVATSGHSTEEPCHVVTRHMLEVSE